MLLVTSIRGVRDRQSVRGLPSVGACWDAGVVPVSRDSLAGSSPLLRLVGTTAG